MLKYTVDFKGFTWVPCNQYFLITVLNDMKTILSQMFITKINFFNFTVYICKMNWKIINKSTDKVSINNTIQLDL